MLFYNPLTHETKDYSNEELNKIREAMKKVDKNVIDVKFISFEDFVNAMTNKETFKLY